MNRSGGSGRAAGLSKQISATRALLVLLLALVTAATLVFAIFGPVLDGANAVADGGWAAVAADWSFGDGLPHS